MKSIGFWLSAALIVLALDVPGQAEETGRTDGPENSEYGKGGNPFGTPSARAYLTGSFGSGFLDTEGPRDTGFQIGIEAGYEIEEWLAIQAGYAHVTDSGTDIIGAGAIFSYPAYPMVYSAGIHASLYTPDSGDRSFGIAPGVGADIILNDRIRLGLNYRHDFMFTDNQTTEMDRVFAGLKFYF